MDINDANSKKMESAMRKQALAKILDEKARQRLNNIRLTKPIVAEQLEAYIIQLHSSGQIRGMIKEDQMIKILEMLSPKRDFKITRR